MMVFKSSKNGYLTTFLWLIVLVMMIIPILAAKEGTISAGLIFGMVLSYALAILLIWILTDTRYVINGDVLHYASGPIRGTIIIGKIHRIEHLKSWYVNTSLKPALGNKGLILYYNKYDSIYISPKDKSSFIAEMLRINPEIGVI